MLNKTNVLLNFTKRSLPLWSKRVALKCFQPLTTWEPLTILYTDSNFNFAKYYASKVEQDDEKRNEIGKQHEPKPSPFSMVANVVETVMPQDGKDETKAELEDIIKAHNDNMDKLINSFQEQLNQHRERSQNQKLEAQEFYQKMVDKLQNERPNLKQLPKLDFAKQVSTERDRKTAMEQELLKDNDPKYLADEKTRLRKELEAEQTKNQQQGDKYYDLMSFFNATKRNLLDKIEDEKKNATKYVFKALLPVIDTLEVVNCTLNAQHIDGESKNHQKLHMHMKFAYTELCTILKRQKVMEIDAVGKVFKHQIHQIADTKIDENIPPNTVISVERKGYMIGDYCLRLAKVIVALRKK